MTTPDPSSPEEFLARAPLFARLSRRSLRKLADLCVPRDYAEGAEMITEGDTGLGLFIITSGRVGISKSNGDGVVTLAEMGPGDLLGEMALIDDQPRSATATALEETRCLLITRNCFQTLVRKDPEVAWCIVPTLAERIRSLQQQMIRSGDRAWTPAAGDEAGGGSTDILDDPPRSDTPSKAKRSRVPSEEWLLRLLRGQHTATVASVSAFRGVLESMEKFLRTLASESGLDDAGSTREVAADLPRSLMSATSAGMKEMERIPERLLERYRRSRDGIRRS